jgi:hypothetical protein
MHTYGHSLVFTTTLLVFFFVLWLVRRRSIGERFAILWLVISVLLLIASSVGYRYLFEVAKFVGVPYPPSALFFLAIAALTLLIIELFAWVSKLNDRTRVLTQQLAILRERFDRERASSTSEPSR